MRLMIMTKQPYLGAEKTIQSKMIHAMTSQSNDPESSRLITVFFVLPYMFRCDLWIIYIRQLQNVFMCS